MWACLFTENWTSATYVYSHRRIRSQMQVLRENVCYELPSWRARGKHFTRWYKGPSSRVSKNKKNCLLTFPIPWSLWNKTVKTIFQNINVFFVTLDCEIWSCLICEILIFSGVCVGGNIKCGNKVFNWVQNQISVLAIYISSLLSL